jgi:hypothetical protein
VAFFFVSYVVVVSIVLMNVVIAVLLQGFITSIEEQERQHDFEFCREKRNELAGALDPVLETLSDFTSNADLRARIDAIFALFDVDDSGQLSYQEMKDGFSSLMLEPQIEFSPDDFTSLTQQHALCSYEDSEGGWVLDRHSFAKAMRTQLTCYSERLLAQVPLARAHTHAGRHADRKNDGETDTQREEAGLDRKSDGRIKS